MRVRACETLRAAIAKATRLRAAAEAAAIEATSDGSTEVKNNQSQKWNGTTTAVASSNGNDNDGSDSNGNGDGAPVAEKPYSGPSLSRIIECRTQAEHRAIAIACSNLRASVDLPPVAAAGPALLPSFGGGGGGGGNASSVVTSRASFSGGGSQASSNRGGGGGVGLSGRLGDASMRSGRVGSEYGSPRDSSTMVPALWVALDSLVGQGGPWSGLQTPLSSPYLQGRAGTSDYDGVNVMDPNQAGNFTGALSMEQVGRVGDCNHALHSFTSLLGLLLGFASLVLGVEVLQLVSNIVPSNSMFAEPFHSLACHPLWFLILCSGIGASGSSCQFRSPSFHLNDEQR